jgi:hypothetical protein
MKKHVTIAATPWNLDNAAHHRPGRRFGWLVGVKFYPTNPTEKLILTPP